MALRDKSILVNTIQPGLESGLDIACQILFRLKAYRSFGRFRFFYLSESVLVVFDILLQGRENPFGVSGTRYYAALELSCWWVKKHEIEHEFLFGVEYLHYVGVVSS